MRLPALAAEIRTFRKASRLVIGVIGRGYERIFYGRTATSTGLEKLRATPLAPGSSNRPFGRIKHVPISAVLKKEVLTVHEF